MYTPPPGSPPPRRGCGGVSIGSRPVSVLRPHEVSETASRRDDRGSPGSNRDETVESASEVFSRPAATRHAKAPQPTLGSACGGSARGGWVGSPQAGKIKTPVASYPYVCASNRSGVGRAAGPRPPSPFAWSQTLLSFDDTSVLASPALKSPGVFAYPGGASAKGHPSGLHPFGEVGRTAGRYTQ